METGWLTGDALELALQLGLKYRNGDRVRVRVTRGGVRDPGYSQDPTPIEGEEGTYVTDESDRHGSSLGVWHPDHPRYYITHNEVIAWKPKD